MCVLLFQKLLLQNMLKVEAWELGLLVSGFGLTTDSVCDVTGH